MPGNGDQVLNGPVAADQVSCLSCHRAHASGWEYALRWNMEGEFMTYNNQFPGTDTTPTVPQFSRGRLGAETQAAYYDRPIDQVRELPARALQQVPRQGLTTTHPTA